MKDNKLTIVINKPIAEVFAFCITPPQAKLWIEDIINETTNEWPAKVGTVYTEYKRNNTSFNIIVTDYKVNEYIEWKTENDKYHVRYIFTSLSLNITQLEYVEYGEVLEPFTNEVLIKLKSVIESN